jgi:ABC transporter substrate binding protein
MIARLRRREFITLLGGAAAAWPVAAHTQQPAMPVIGYFSGRSPEAEAPILAAFRRGLEETVHLAGQNIAIEFRFSDGQDDQLPALAAELVRRRVAVLVTTDRPSAVAAKAATATIPIVFASGLDAVEIGLVASLNRPGGNATGVNIFTTELGPKRLELLRQVVPNAGTIAFLVNPNTATAGRQVMSCRRRPRPSDSKSLPSTPAAKRRSTKPSRPSSSAALLPSFMQPHCSFKSDRNNSSLWPPGTRSRPCTNGASSSQPVG